MKVSTHMKLIGMIGGLQSLESKSNDHEFRATEILKEEVATKSKMENEILEAKREMLLRAAAHLCIAADKLTEIKR